MSVRLTTPTERDELRSIVRAATAGRWHDRLLEAVNLLERATEEVVRLSNEVARLRAEIDLVNQVVDDLEVERQRLTNENERLRD